MMRTNPIDPRAMKAQLEETSNAARKTVSPREELMAKDALRRGEDYLRLETNTDSDARKRAETLLAGENQILEMVATGQPLPVILDGLCRLVDKLSHDSLASILLFDPSCNCLSVVRAQLSRSVPGGGGWRQDWSQGRLVRHGAFRQRASHRL